MSLQTITDAVKARAADLAGLNARVRFDLGDTGSILVDATTMPPVVSDEDGEVDCTVRLSVEDLEKLLAGALNPTLAHTLGKLKIDGSMGIAMKLASMLNE